ncbi:response regulator [Nonomuraea angiospora]|uniref:DNA-binding NarL/FixJ family response regulator n=1 Tax=Nonomuraea angiospora TaxID=46172 RepID=A0ABR9M2D6_9ACTN|nr:response regulator transcription factor [Nonomuraea angiospora]MBE1587049.1 DNA-binding NarL/FixJ family response regulator [Nonomuraea angiospora]MDX3108465.1 response regulator transcription factor [Nonomuraea angiospora]
MPIRLIIVDDHPVVRDGLRGIFTDDEFEVVGEAGDGFEALAVVERTNPDVVLTDLRMPRMKGAELIRRLREQAPDVRVLVLTTFDDDVDVLPAIEEGATGYLLKDTPRAELRRAVQAAARGETVLSPSVAGVLTQKLRAPRQQPLSRRELEVLSLISRGATNRDVAKRLFITEATVKTHLLHIFAKLEVNDRAAAVAAAYETGLLRPGADG